MIAALVLAALVAAASPTPSPERRFVDRPVRENALVGEFSAPADGGRHPALIVLGGFEGDVVPGEAYGLALQGYSAFAVAYFGKSPLPNAADKVPVETVSRAIDWLRAQPEVDPAHIGIVGISQGSALALLAAGRDPRIRAVAVISPSAYVWFAPAFDNAPDRSSWSENNGPLPFIGPDRHAEDRLGGSTPANSRAAADTWARTLTFFGRTL